MIDELESELKDKLNRAVSHFEQELKKIRSGRAHPSLLDSVEVEIYSQKQPISHIARVLSSDARTLTITPYDPSSLSAITKAIRDDQSLGLNPVDDGKVIHVPIPDMTTERREQAVRLLSTKAEDCRVALRSARHDILDQSKKLAKAGDVSEDEAKRLDQLVTRELESANRKIDELTATKEAELKTI
jgi:ribosome recycling factor